MSNFNNNEGNLPHAFIEGNAYNVSELTNYHFQIEGDHHDFQPGTTYQVVLYHKNGERLSVSTRIRKAGAGFQCRFSDISLKDKEKLNKWLSDGEDSGDALNKLTYDEIAKGATGKPDTTEKVVKRDRKGREKLSLTQQLVKSAPVFVFLGMILVTVIFFASVVILAKKRNRIKVNNGSLVGNYLPIQSSEDGQVQNCFVNEGDYVKAGDILFSISNSKLEEEFSVAKAELIAAEATVDALQQLIQTEEQKFDIAVKQARQRIEVAKAEYAKSVALVPAQRDIVEMIAYVKKSRTKYDINYHKEVGSLKKLEADVVLKQRLLSEEQAALEAMIEGNFTMFGENVDDRLSKYMADVRIANAEKIKAKAAVDVIKSKIDRLNVRAPRDGRIFALYRFNGEYVKAADAILSISSDGRSWAFGAVQLGESHRIRPGQIVRVQIPSINQEVNGRVASVGHRSIYTSGGWSQDFRVDIHSVPIKVWLPEMEENPPTGLRVKMSVNLPFRWPWEDPEEYDPESIKQTASIIQDN